MKFFFFFLLTALGPTSFKFMTKGITSSQNIFLYVYTIKKNRTPTPHIYTMSKVESCCAPTLFVAYIAELLLSLLDSNRYKMRNQYKKLVKFGDVAVVPCVVPQPVK
jgi:hypothetical protein